MDVIDCELKRYDTMQTELENFKKSFDNLCAAPKDQSKSVDDLDTACLTLLNEEKPKEVNTCKIYTFDLIWNRFDWFV